MAFEMQYSVPSQHKPLKVCIYCTPTAPCTAVSLCMQHKYEDMTLDYPVLFLPEYVNPQGRHCRVHLSLTGIIGIVCLNNSADHLFNTKITLQTSFILMTLATKLKKIMCEVDDFWQIQTILSGTA